MPWDYIKDNADKLKIESFSDIEKRAALVALNATPENLNLVIGLLSASNLGLVAHMCGEVDETGTLVKDCQETDLPESMKLLLIYGLMALRDRELKRKENAA